MLDGWAYGDLLRVVGDLLDAESAEQVEIVQHPEALTLTWASAANQFTHRSVRDVNLDVLQQQARALRGKEKAGGTSPRVELLRTLGQLLDYEQLTLGESWKSHTVTV